MFVKDPKNVSKVRDTSNLTTPVLRVMAINVKTARNPAAGNSSEIVLASLLTFDNVPMDTQKPGDISRADAHVQLLYEICIPMAAS